MSRNSQTLFALFLIFLLSVAVPARADEVTFQAADGLKISGEVTKPKGYAKTAIVLFHQANSSRGEYTTIAPKLAQMGYLTLAIDQRSGSAFSGVTNETAARARAARKGTAYRDAIPDLQAAAAYARSQLGAEKIIAWGSSYSAALVLALAGQDKSFADGILAFSPGEYFRGNPPVKANAAKIAVPVFITSAKNETRQWRKIFEAIPQAMPKTGFVPEDQGVHGSSALIPNRSSNEAEYWAAVETFLRENFPVEAD